MNTDTISTTEEAALFLVKKAKGEYEHGKDEFCPFCKAEGKKKHRKGCYMIPIVNIVGQILD